MNLGLMQSLFVVSPQRRFISEGSITIPTFERLPCVSDQVATQPRRVTKYFGAQRTIVKINIVRALSHVCPQMNPERLPLRKSLIAVRAIVRFLSGMRHQVPIQDLFLCETLLTNLTLERPLSSVNPLVAHQRRTRGEPLFAHSATETSLLHVHGGVAPQLDSSCEGFGALRTFEYFQFAVFVHFRYGRAHLGGFSLFFGHQFHDYHRAVFSRDFYLHRFALGGDYFHL